jgi:DNA-directed RNA polymerase subunit RPC12/RpoP
MHTQTVVSGRSQPGELNGRSKLRDQVIRLLREKRRRFRERGEGDGTYAALAREFELHPKHVKKIAIGEVRASAGGPIETPVRLKELQHRPRLFDRTRVIRCPDCGQRVYPSAKDPERCIIHARALVPFVA